ncbi:sugar O-acetyltransferase [Acetobacter syzygii]|uniref:Acetyltransferase n=1 Tax=Acetobacter syzygii TaxID=146476 RepID=A0A270BEJ4_9PROT|nr:sugar O-acetyltransferase [Acetobacter syzygii]PAL23445.1 O-acetyltransferase [Acetobacter syzygii]PAL24126.1 O-acetyltransferase [Acetobacter syzygii]GAN71709.1 maltose O-acetyltransferase [Acetobacter syzygii]GBR62241.1 acetyltransferase [Acetobacter syzygii NRIC 0483]GEL56852.1 acetyltransferase [Acetobacter syzygii]
MTLAEQMAHMRTGAMYNDLTPELVQARQNAVLLTNRYNASFGRPQPERERILRELLGHIGQGVHFEPTLRCEFGRNITIGHNFYANFDCVLLDAGGIEIGDDVLFGPRVGLYTANHALDPQERAMGGCHARPIHIGNRVWVGAGVHINPGVRIGEGSIIGAGSVVTRDVPAGVVAAGVPCRVIRPLTAEDRTGFAP